MAIEPSIHSPPATPAEPIVKQVNGVWLPRIAEDPCQCCDSPCSADDCVPGWATGAINVENPTKCLEATELPQIHIRDTSTPPPGWCWSAAEILNANKEHIAWLNPDRTITIPAYSGCVELYLRSYAVCCDPSRSGSCFDTTRLDAGAADLSCCCYPRTCITDYLQPGNAKYIIPIPRSVIVGCEHVLSWGTADEPMVGWPDEVPHENPIEFSAFYMAAVSFFKQFIPGAIELPLQPPETTVINSIAHYYFERIGPPMPADVVVINGTTITLKPAGYRPFINARADLYCDNIPERPSRLEAVVHIGLIPPGGSIETEDGSYGCGYAISTWFDLPPNKCGGNWHFPGRVNAICSPWGIFFADLFAIW